MSKDLINRRNFLYLSAMGVVSTTLAAVAGSGQAAPVHREEEQKQQKFSDEQVSLLASEQMEAPQLAQRVKIGALPPLADRLPEHPLLLTPIDKIGKYGGRFKQVHWWQLGGVPAGMYGHSPLRWVNDGLGVGPGQCETWETNENNTIWTLYFRKGMKWSDGSPVTTADVMYWWNDMVLDPDQPDQVPSEFPAIDGVLPIFTAINDFTLTITFPKPAPLTAKRLAMWVNGQIGYKWIVPSVYAKQFNPKYNPAYTNYIVHDLRIDYKVNSECPVLTAWMLTEYHEGDFSTWERNPYYYAIDPAGKQLPYVDGMDVKPSLDAQFFLTQAAEGNVSWEVYTYQLTLGDIPALLANAVSGNYEVRFWDAGSGTGMMYYWNHDLRDPAKRALYRNPKFKAAMSLAIDRGHIQHIVYFDTGTPTTGTMSPKASEFNFNAQAEAHYEAFRTLYVDYDPVRAGTLLDAIGVVDVNEDGFREMPDGSALIVRVDISSDVGGEAIQVLEITRQNWIDIGLNVVVNQIPPGDFSPAWRAGQLEFRTAWEVGDGPDHLLYPSWVVPDEAERWAPLTGQLRLVAGTSIEGTELSLSPWDRTPPRFDPSDPEYSSSKMPDLHALYDQAIFEADEIERMELVWQINEIHMTYGPYFLGTVCNTPRIVIVSKDLENVPTREQLALGGFCNPWIIPYPAITNPETYAFKKPYDVFLPLLRR